MKTLVVDYKSIKENLLRGRYIPHLKLMSVLNSKALNKSVQIMGKSVDGNSIPSLTLGQGSRKILLWSQMHGNETTTTKALMDLVNFLENNKVLADTILSKCTITFIPMLNPDGANRYTRNNANDIDLNRDAQEMSQPESRILRSVYDKIMPDYCFNLHDQRTIYSAGSDPKPATISFLAPAHDIEKSISDTRARSMQLISGIFQYLQKKIPGNMGRYDDSFNPQCVGDTFQMLGTPTILLEAGHIGTDYERENTREIIFLALLEALCIVATDNVDTYKLESYFEISENKKLYFDILLHNAHLIDSTLKDGHSLGILYREELKGKQIHFHPYIESRGNLEGHYGHITYDCKKESDYANLKNNKQIKGLINGLK